MDFKTMSQAAKNAATPEKKAYWEARLNKALGIPVPKFKAEHWWQQDLIHTHTARHMRRKISHDHRKGTKLLAPGKTAKLDDVDIVATYGRLSRSVLSERRFDTAVARLNKTGMRLDLKPSAVDKAKKLFSQVFGLRRRAA